MKRLLILLFILVNLSALGQTTVTADRIVANRGFYLKDRWVDSIGVDTSMQGEVRSVPSSDAVHRMVAGRLAALQAALSAASIDSFTYATRRYVDSSIAANPGGGVSHLDSLSDVSKTPSTEGVILQYSLDSAKYLKKPAALYSLTDPQNGDILVYENGVWVNQPNTGGTGSPDSIRVSSTLPTTGNVYIDSDDNRLYYKSGGYWYKVAIEDSTTTSTGGDPGGGGGYAYSQNFDASLTFPPEMHVSVADVVVYPNASTSPNAVQFPNNNMLNYVYYNEPVASDAFTFSARIRTDETTNYSNFVLGLRSDSVNWTANNAYAVAVLYNYAADPAVNGILVYKRTAGVDNYSLTPGGTSGRIGQGTTFQPGVTYEFRATISGTTTTTIAVQVIRVSDGYYLTNAGTWQAGAATAITVTDSTAPHTANGYAGVLFYHTNEGTPNGYGYLDNFKIE